MSTNSRKQCTSGERCDVHGLADAIYCALHHARLPLKDIALTVGARAGYLMDAANPDREDTQFQARLIAPVTRVSGNDAIIEQIARDCGGVFVRTPTLSGAHADITIHTAKILREVADVIQAPAAALGNDQRIDAGECAEIEKQIDEAVAALMALKPIVRASAGLPLDTTVSSGRGRRA